MITAEQRDRVGQVINLINLLADNHLADRLHINVTHYKGGYYHVHVLHNQSSISTCYGWADDNKEDDPRLDALYHTLSMLSTLTDARVEYFSIAKEMPVMVSDE